MKKHTPRPIYFKHGMITFNVKNNQTFYSVSVWNDQGTTLSLIKTGKYDGQDVKSLLTKAEKCDS